MTERRVPGPASCVAQECPCHLGDRALTYQDRTIICSDCGKPFVFTAGEQQFFAEKGFGTGPKRCPQCRAARRAEREGTTMGGPGGPRPGGFAPGPRPGGPAGPGYAPRPGAPGGAGPGAPGAPGAPGVGPRGPYVPRPGGTAGPYTPRPGGPGAGGFGPRPPMGATPPLMRGRGGPRLVVPVEEPYRINHRIRVPEVRVIVENEEGEEQNLGVMATPQAMRMAEERDLDLVEVAPQAQPPVCKIMDYGRFKYSVERKAREAKRAGQAGRAASEMKDVQLSPRIDDHDRQFKVERARGFLSEGHPVRMVVRFLGRDMRHPEVGMKALQEALEELGKMLPITVDQQPRMEGRQLFALVRLAKGAKLPSERANGAARAEAAGPEDATAPEAPAAAAAPVASAAPAAPVAPPAEPAVPAPAGDTPATESETPAAAGTAEAAETPVPLAEPVRAAS